MKIRSFLLLIPLTLVGTSVVTALHGQSMLPTFAASDYKSATLPKTIDLNPVSESDIRAYYASLGSGLSGNDLLKALKPILKEGQAYHSYDTSSNNPIWRMYEITDRDWTLSPASAIANGVYDPSTNIITNYTYGSNSSKGDNPYLHLLYRNRGVEAGYIHAWDTHGGNDGIDREHVWPKSRGFGKDDTGEEQKVAGARGDIHHLMAGDSYVNSSTHSNNSYGFVDPTKITDNAGEKYKIGGVTVVAGNYRGTSATYGTSLGNNEVFEPQDCDKGDIARACFYMVARYNNLAGDDTNIDAGNPNLFLEDTVDTTTIYSTPDRPVSLGILQDLLAWHKMDPVDDYEIHRNDLIYRNYAKNRNPFIDFPNWVDYIWGTADYDAVNHKSINRVSTPTGSANPSTDPVGTFTPASPIVSIALSGQKTQFTTGDSFAFGGKVTGAAEDGSTRDVTALCLFSGYDLSKEGTQTVTVTYNGTIKATYEIHVEKAKTIFDTIPLPVLIGVGAGALLLLIILLIAIPASRKKAVKHVKKTAKNAVKSSARNNRSRRK